MRENCYEGKSVFIFVNQIKKEYLDYLFRGICLYICKVSKQCRLYTASIFGLFVIALIGHSQILIVKTILKSCKLEGKKKLEHMCVCVCVFVCTY